MRDPLRSLDRRAFDTVIIGGGINGASAAQHLAAAGYAVLLVDKADYGAGSSSRSSRLLHCGLRYLAPGRSIWEFVRHPDRLVTALGMARQAIHARAQIVHTAPERTRRMNFCFPIYRRGPYKKWQLDLAFRILGALGPKDPPLDYRILGRPQVAEIPLVRWLRDPDQLSAVAVFREYQVDWPERMCADAILDAERMGGIARNYTAVEQLSRNGNGLWHVALVDVLDDTRAQVTAKSVLNMAGIWIDGVNARAPAPVGRKVLGTKGAHIMVQLPPECAAWASRTLNRRNEPFYCVPWRGMHFFGPTEILYEGDPDDVCLLEQEVEFLLDEANDLLPALHLTRNDVLFGWAGVRPLTYDPAQPMGKRAREIHDFSVEGLPGLFAMTAGPVMTHRSAGQSMAAAVRRTMLPSRPPQEPSYAARHFPDNRNHRRCWATIPTSSLRTCSTPLVTSMRAR